MQTQTFRAICPDTKELHVFQIISDKGKTVGWCTKCLRSHPLSELTDGRADEDAKDRRLARRPSKRK